LMLIIRWWPPVAGWKGVPPWKTYQTIGRHMILVLSSCSSYS
jgi:hypothetical protein